MSQAQKISIGGVKKARNEGLKIITANTLLTGKVVYLTPDHKWSEDINKAQACEGDLAMSLLKSASLDEREIVGPYLMDVTNENSTFSPSGRTLLREKIRLAGPTIPSDYSTHKENSQNV